MDYININVLARIYAVISQDVIIEGNWIKYIEGLILFLTNACDFVIISTEISIKISF
jgi:hypothetical protein